jgi:predicted RNA binding protein YcfA (HicA-like mRNA interferase family)
MAKLLNQRTAIKLLERYGWTKAVGGKHGVKMIRSGDRPITLPTHRGGDYGLDLTRRILKQAGIDRREL